MTDTDLINRLESGEHQQSEILIFEKWLGKNHPDFKGAAELKKKIFEPDLGTNYNLFYHYSTRAARVRAKIQECLALDRGAMELADLVAEAIDLIKAECGGKIGEIELAAALRVRFFMSFLEIEDLSPKGINKSAKPDSPPLDPLKLTSEAGII